MILTNLKILAVVLGTVGLYTWVANVIPQVESEVPEELVFTGDFSTDELLEAGEALYLGAGGCIACHGSGTRAPNLLTDEGGTGLIGERCTTRVPGQDCKSYLHASMVAPNDFVVSGYGPIMPDMSRTLSETQIWAIIAFLQSLGGEVTVTADDVQSAAGDGVAAFAEEQPRGGPAAPGAGGAALTDPAAIFRAQGCVACHVRAGEGGPIGPELDDVGQRLSREEIRKAILEPNADTTPGYEAMAGTMPAIYGQQLTAAQLEALVVWLGGQP
ncbi:MAG TPA: c-type cytochrome [Longimicrobiales bacterium]|nr:c-type cytochrome [Longimicrobiales bacterium]